MRRDSNHHHHHPPTDSPQEGGGIPYLGQTTLCHKCTKIYYIYIYIYTLWLCIYSIYIYIFINWSDWPTPTLELRRKKNKKNTLQTSTRPRAPIPWSYVPCGQSFLGGVAGGRIIPPPVMNRQLGSIQEIGPTVGPTGLTDPKQPNESNSEESQLTERGLLVRSHSIFDGE